MQIHKHKHVHPVGQERLSFQVFFQRTAELLSEAWRRFPQGKEGSGGFPLKDTVSNTKIYQAVLVFTCAFDTALAGFFR